MVKQGDVVTGYEILQVIHIDDTTMLLGENQNDGDKYIVGDYYNNGFNEGIVNGQVSNDYLEMLKYYLKKQIEQLQKIEEKQTGFEPITKDLFEIVTSTDRLKGQVVVIKPEVFYPESRTSENMLFFATGGFGSYPNSKGSAVFVENLYTREKSRFNRNDIIGIVPEDKIPDWARKNLELIVKDFKNNERGER